MPMVGRPKLAKTLPKALGRRRDFARQRWPFGQHKIAVCRVAPTAAPRIPRVNLPMAAPFGLGSRRGICVYHRRCGTTSSARRERPLVHIRTRICAGDPVPLKPATLLPSSPTNCRKLILKRLAADAVAALLTALGADPPPRRRTDWMQRDRALILTALLAGLRADELVRANVGDLRRTDDGAVIHVRGKGGKDRGSRSSRHWSTSSSAISTPGPPASPPRPNGAPPRRGIGRLAGGGAAICGRRR